MALDTVEISMTTLTELLDYRREYFKICDEFKVPIDRRHEPQVAQSIIERIHTYLTSYLIRRNATEQSNGAAFVPPLPIPLVDPETTT